ncbi:MAG: manganese ABC transporter permease [Chloroflexi bacterium]|nr:manganese ABC transporter permease [Chloroflexota bacterium]
MQRAMIATLLIAAISGVIGCFIVVRGMSFFGEALGHSILPGVAVAYIFGANLFIGGLVAGVLTALGIGWLSGRGRLREDTAIGVVFVGMFALGIVIISTARSFAVDLTHILFGNVLGVTSSDLITVAISGVIVLGAILLFYKELLAQSFDPALMATLKLPGEALRMLLLVLIAVTIVASLQTVGISLMLAMLITPAATAQLLVRRMHHMMIVSALIGMISGVIGLYLSWQFNIPSGAIIVLTTTAVFLIVFAFTRLRGLAE